MDMILPALIVVVPILIALFLLHRSLAAMKRDRAGDPAMALLQNQLNAGLEQTARQVGELQASLRDSLQNLGGQVSRGLADTHASVGSRLDNTTKVIGDVRQQLGQLEQSSRRMVEMGKDISRLEEILRPPKLRGSLGELFLAELLGQILPTDHYQLQYRFQGGETVDAVIFLRTGIVPIDAKFPLENFRRLLDATQDTDTTAARKAFVKDIKGHIDDISRKYIRTDEKTFDFALMYIPAENVYYETVIKEDAYVSDTSLFAYALKKRVIPVSPNSFYAYLQTIVLGLKGMRVEEHSREILDNLSRLRKEFDNFADAFRLVGQHLDNSTKKFGEAQTRFGKMESKVEQIDGLARGLKADDENVSEPRLPKAEE